jgi:membrane protease subunit HflC
MKHINSILVAFALAVMLIAFTFFTVYQTDLAFVLRFKKIKTKADDQSLVYQPGLHGKVPLIDEVVRFDTRATILDIKASRITTVEKKDLLVDYYVLWRMRDIAIYYNRTQGVKSKTEALL